MNEMTPTLTLALVDRHDGGVSLQLRHQNLKNVFQAIAMLEMAKWDLLNHGTITKTENKEGPMEHERHDLRIDQ